MFWKPTWLARDTRFVIRTARALIDPDLYDQLVAVSDCHQCYAGCHDSP